jgi:hypothetical protein
VGVSAYGRVRYFLSRGERHSVYTDGTYRTYRTNMMGLIGLWVQVSFGRGAGDTPIHPHAETPTRLFAVS